MKTGTCGLTWNKKTNKKDYDDKGNNTSYYHTGNGLIVIDIDSKILPDELVAILGDLKPTTKTKRGSHYYFTHDSSIEYINRTKLTKDNTVDIRGDGGKIFYEYRGDSKDIAYNHKPKRIYELKDYPIIKLWVDDVAIQKHAPKKDYDDTVGEMSLDEVEKLLSRIDVLEYRSRDKWLAIIASVYRAGGSEAEDLARKWSQGDSEKYDKKSFDDIWNQCVTGNFGEGYSKGTLIKASNPNYIPPEELFAPEKIKEKVNSPRELLQRYFITDKEIKELEDQVYLIEGLILKGGLGGMIGDSGSGKSHLLFCFLLQMLQEHKDMEAFFFDIDSGLQYTKDRIQHIKSKVDDRFEYLSSHGEIDARSALEAMEELAKHDLKNTIVVFDSLVELAEGDINESKKVNPILVALKALRDAGATVLVVHHNNKDGRYAGSFNIRSAMDYTFNVTKDGDKITLDVDKDRGIFKNHTFEIVDFQTCKISETTYFSGEDIKQEKNLSLKREKDLVKDEDNIKLIKSVIKELELPNKTNIKEAMHAKFGTNDRTTNKLLVRYNEIEWKSKVTPSDIGAPSIMFKCI